MKEKIAGIKKEMEERIDSIILHAKISCPPHLNEFKHLIPKIVEFLEIKKPDLMFYESKIEAMREVLKKLEEQAPHLSRNEGPRFISSSEQRIRDREKVKEVMPHIIKLRKKFFKTGEPPFPGDMDKAINWLRTGPDTQRELLEGRSRYISFEAGIDQESLIIYTLTGFKPKSPVYRISREEVIKAIDTDRHAIITETDFPIKLEIFRPVSDKDFKKIINELKKHVGVKVAISEKHERLYFLVEEMGPPPEKKSSPRGAVMKFWKEVLKAWNKKYEDEKYKDADTIMRTYVRMMKKLDQL